MNPRTATTLALVSYGVLALCLTMLFLAMRELMEIGGSCGQGGPDCPGATAATIPLSIIVGLGAGFASVFFSLMAGLPVLAGLAWPVLFCSLGWNFLEYAFDTSEGTVETGFLICGIVFWVMGAGPLVGVLYALRGSQVARTLQGLPRGVARRIEGRAGIDPERERIVVRGGYVAVASAAALGAVTGIWLQTTLL